MNKNYSLSRTKWLRLGLLPILAMLFGVAVQAQNVATNYASFAQSAGTYTAITGGTVLGAGDDAGYNVAIPGGFIYNGVTYANMRVGTNGWISFHNATAATATTGYTPISSATGFTGLPVIAPFAQDLEPDDLPGTTSEVRFEQIGTLLVVQWSGYQRWVTGTTGTESINFQARLDQCTGVISFVYGDFLNVTTSTAASQVGVRGTSITFATDIRNRLVNTTAPQNTWLTSVVGTAAGSTCRLSSAAPATIPASGTTYTWTPNATAFPGGCFAPSSPVAAVTSTSSADVTWVASACGSPAASYDYEVRTTGACGSGGATFASGNVTSPTVSLTGLAPYVTYTICVRTNCAVGTSAWVSTLLTIRGDNCAGAFDLATLTSPLSTTTVGLANDFGQLQSSTASGTNTAPDDIFFIDVPACASFTATVTTSASDMVYTIRTGGTCPGTTQVGSQDPNNVPITFANTTSSVQRAWFIVDGFSTASGTYTMTWSIDTACQAPQAVVATPAGTGFNATWSSCSSASGFQWELQTPVGAQGTNVVQSGIGTTPTSLSLTGLSSLTAYRLWVRNECAPGVFSPWVSANFTTLCTGTPNTATVTPASATRCLNGPTATFTASGQSTGAGLTYQWQVGTSSSGPWSNIAGATASTYIVQATQLSSFYRFVTTCAGSGLTSESLASELIGDIGATCAPAYSVTRTAGATYVPVFPGGTNFTGWQSVTSGDDNVSGNTAIPFSFTYFGVTYTNFRVNTNGFLSLGTTLSNAVNTWINTLGTNNTTTRAVIAPMWDDLVVPGAAFANLNFISYRVDGTPGSQVLTIEWAGMEKFGYPGPNMNFQVKLYEGTNDIEFVYGSMTGTNGTVDNAYSYAVGLTSDLTGALTAANVLSLQQFNTDIFGGTGVNTLTVVPECNTSIFFTAGGSIAPGTPLPAITNDESASAIPLLVGNSSPAEYCGWYRSRGATASTGITACSAATPGNADDDVWFQFFNSQVQDIRVSVVPEAGYNAVVQVFDNSLNALGCVNAVGVGLVENLNLPGLGIGGPYYIRVYDAATGASVGGHFHVSVFNPPPVPANDNPAGAITLAGGTTCSPSSYTSLGATAGDPLAIPATAPTHVPAAGTAGVDDDVWFSFDAVSTSAEIRVQSGSGYNAAFQLYNAGVSPGTFNAAIPAVDGQINATSTLGLEANTYTGLTIGNRYFVRVFHVSAGSGLGGFTICRRDLCEPVTAFTATADNVALDVDFAWTGGTNADLYFDVAPLAAPTGSTTPTQANVASGVTVSGLAADTQYQVYRRSNCGSGIVGDWVGPVNYDTFCPALTAVTAVGNAATLEAVVSWTGGAGDIYYVVDGGAAPVDGVTAATNSNVSSPFTVTGLAAGTVYDIWVRSYCNTTSQGLWVSAGSFDTYVRVPSTGSSTITACTAVLTDHAGPTANYSSSVSGFTTINAPSPTSFLNLSGSFALEGCCDDFIIYAGAGTGGAVLFDNGTTGTGTFSVSTTTAGSSITIFFDSDTSVELAGFVATLACSDCAPLTAITAVGDAFAVDADLTWTGGTGDVYWGATPLAAPTSSTGPTINDATSPLNLPGLTAATSYQAYVRSDCGGAGVGFWQGPFNFNTNCPPIVGTPNVITNPTAGTGVVNWTSGVADLFFGNATSTTAPTGATVPTVAGASPGASISGLIQSTNYVLYYRSNCAGNTGAWLGPINFNTFITVPANGTNAITVCNATIYDNGGPDNNYGNNQTGSLTITPPFGRVYDFDLTITGGDSGFDFLIFYEGATVNPANIIGVASGNGVYPTFSSSTPGGPVTIQWDTDFSFVGSGFELDVACVLPPPCPNLLVFAPTPFGAGFSVDYNGGPGFTGPVQIEYGATGFTQGTGVTVTVNSDPATVTGLASNTLYELYIRRDCSGSGDGFSDWSGPFSVTTSVANDVCAGATNVICGVPVFGDTDIASNDNMSDQCGAGNGTQPSAGLWYVYTGNNQAVTASLVNSNTSYDSRISIYQGTCGNLVCVAGNDDAQSTLQSEITWNALTGTTYYILVHGFSAFDTGAFELSLTCNALCAPQASNDICSNSTALNVQSPFTTTYVNGNNTCASAGPNASISFACGGSFATYNDVWYTFDSDEYSNLVLSVQPGTTGTPASGTHYYALYTGSSCSALTYANQCGTFEIGQSISVPVTPQTIYRMRVYNSTSDVGDFTPGTFQIAVVEPYTNDVRANALSISPRQFPSCLSGNVVTQNLDVATAGTGALGGAAPAGAGQDLWYQFVAITNACRISAVCANDTYLELQNAAGTTLVASEDDGSAGNEVLIADNLVAGQTYFVQVRNQDAASGGANATVCIQYLNDSRCNNVTNTFNSLCSGFKAAYTAANSYVVEFEEVPTIADPVVDTYIGTTTGGSTNLAMSSVSGLQMGRQYVVSVDCVYNLTDAGGNAVPVTVLSDETCTVTINNAAELNLRASDAQPNQRFLNSTVGATAWICGATNYRWELTQLTPLTGIATEFNGPAGNRFLPLASVNVASPGFLVPGATYNVRIAPVYGTTVGSYGSVDQVLAIAGSAMPLFDDETAQNLETRMDEGVGADVALYPNPNNGQIVNLNVYGVETDNVQVRIVDGMGRVVYANQFAVDGVLNTLVSFDKPLASGLYMVEFMYNGTTTTQRMMVQK